MKKLIEKLYKECIAHDELPPVFQQGMDYYHKELEKFILREMEAAYCFGLMMNAIDNKNDSDFIDNIAELIETEKNQRRFENFQIARYNEDIEKFI